MSRAAKVINAFLLALALGLAGADSCAPALADTTQTDSAAQDNNLQPSVSEPTTAAQQEPEAATPPDSGEATSATSDTEASDTEASDTEASGTNDEASNRVLAKNDETTPAETTPAVPPQEEATTGNETTADGQALAEQGDNSTPVPNGDSSSEPGTMELPTGSESESGDGDSSAVASDTSGDATTSQEVEGAIWLNLRTRILLGVVLAFLAIASVVGRYLVNQPAESVNPALIRRFRQRLNAWWLMCAILVFGILLHAIGTVLLFGFVSFWALREFITMTPTRRGDHRALFWALIVFTPLQYVLISLETLGITWGVQDGVDYYGLYSILIPVYASLFVPSRIAMSGDPKRFLERSAQITIGLLICVYSLSYAPAVVNLQLAYSNGSPWTGGSQAGLLFFFILISQVSDVLQWVWGQLVGKRVIAPEVSSSRTWEGFIGGTLCTGLIGGALYWVTPFQAWEAMCMSMVVAIMGTFGGMTMSAIKRDRGVNDYGSLVMGHAGVLDRIDSLCFAAPVFYHITRFFFSA